MSLISRFSDEFDNGVRNRGVAYYRQGAVRIIEGDQTRVRAIVSGELKYTVTLSVKGSALFVSCTCPYFDTDVCKHIWATMLAAETRGYFHRSGSEPSRLIMEDVDFDDEEELYDEDYQQQRVLTRSAAQANLQPNTAISAQQSEKPSAGKQQLSRRSQAMKSRASQ